MKLIGFAPDADPFSAGVLTDCENLIPSVRGMKASPSPAGIGVTALASAASGAAQVVRLDNSRRLFVGTSSALYEWSSSWVDRSDVGGYALGSEDGWQFAQFGNIAIATAKTETLQESNTGAFSAISGAPKARHIETANGFVMVADYDDGTDTPDGWYCSALRDHTDWTPAIATQCANGRLVDSPGPIRALKSLANYAIAYKDGSIYLGQYVGPPIVWAWQMVSSAVGAASPGCVAVTESMHIIMAKDDFVIFDGTRPQSVGNGVREWFFGTELDRQYQYRVQSLHDKSAKVVRWFYPSRAASGTLDRWIAFNYQTGQWGKGTLAIEVPVQWKSGGYTIDGLSALSATIDGLPAIPFDSPFWSAATEVPAIIDTTHTVKALEGPSTGMSMTSGDNGTDDGYTLLRRVRPRWIVKPTSATMTNYYRNDLDDAITTDQTAVMSDGNFDVLRSARWHRITISAVGDCEVSDLAVKAAAKGDR